MSASLIRRASTLVVNGIYDAMLPVRDSYWLSENLPDAVLLTTGRASLLQFHRSVTRQAAAFLESIAARDDVAVHLERGAIESHRGRGCERGSFEGDQTGIPSV